MQWRSPAQRQAQPTPKGRPMLATCAKIEQRFRQLSIAFSRAYGQYKGFRAIYLNEHSKSAHLFRRTHEEKQGGI
jgi:hypothetical protein